MVMSMAANHYTLFDTAIGRCGLAWSERGVVGGAACPRARAATRRGCCGGAPAAARQRRRPRCGGAIDAIAALLRGEPSDCRHRARHGRLPPFHRRVYDVARGIRAGAHAHLRRDRRQLGEPGAARAVGQALGQNPFPIVVPCHRVLAAGGKLGGFSAHGGAVTKRRLLAIEARQLDAVALARSDA